MELSVLEAINAGGNLGLLIIGGVLLKLERRVFKLEWERNHGKQEQGN